MLWSVVAFVLLLGAIVAWEALPDGWRDAVVAGPAWPPLRTAFVVAALLVYASLLPL